LAGLSDLFSLIRNLSGLTDVETAIILALITWLLLQAFKAFGNATLKRVSKRSELRDPQKLTLTVRSFVRKSPFGTLMKHIVKRSVSTLSESRWELLSPTSATADVNAAAEFRNDSSSIIHIKGIDYSHLISAGENDEGMQAEISKSPVFAGGTNNNVFFTYMQSLGVSGGTTGAALDDVSVFANGGKSFNKGDLTLEPGESLYVNINMVVVTAVSGDPEYTIEYEFGG